MDNAQIEQALEDLESRMERLRSLYEQYFMGLEKLEPTVLRKEVDRKLWLLRREQIRNTGLRFKFQMLIQRYNTYQQYWQRIVREIETGTYRRDILKVAQRFGEKDAMTILGRKRAEQYKRLAANQLERRAKRGADPSAEAADRPSMPDITVEEEEDAPVSLSVDDLEVVDDADDEPVTPPRGLPPVRMYGEPDMESLLLAATVGVTTWREPADEPAAAAAPAPERPPIATTTTPAASAPDTSAVATVATSEVVPGKPAAPIAVTAAKPVKPAAASATQPRSRVAELAAQMRARKQEASRPKHEDLEIDQLFEPAEPKPAAAAPTSKRASIPAPRRASSPTLKRVSVPAPPAAEAAPSKRTSDRAPPKRASVPAPPKRTSDRAPPKRASVPAAPVAVPAAPVAVPAAPVAVPASPAAAPEPAAAAPPPGAARTPPARPAVARPAPAQPVAARPAAPAGADLSDQKIREIYAKYVGAKRAANESTAGLTFDKLAASLRAQSDKLKSSHPTRSIDFEVVTKDGKTALRPVIK